MQKSLLVEFSRVDKLITASCMRCMMISSIIISRGEKKREKKQKKKKEGKKQSTEFIYLHSSI